ncbi:hypothetical protein HZH68_001618 [Vespula germanica]|uniref:Uncharacterized protein n=1 Tax=Vespula germanica TaxID=30212 RepID=A0A834U754_VESGE|nr:hypothetical protein HZH68_001618 [Vespula germanica]
MGQAVGEGEEGNSDGGGPRNAEEIQKCVPGKATARVGRETPPRRGHFHQLVNRESYYVYVGSYDAPTTATRFNKNENDNDDDNDDDDDDDDDDDADVGKKKKR